MTTSNARKLFGLALSGALTFATAAVAAPAPETAGTPPLKTSPGATPSTAAPAPAPSAAPSPETTPPPARGEEKRADERRVIEGRPTADPQTTSPASPTGIMNERDVPGQASKLAPKAARDSQRVLTELHKANQLETALGTLAREKASSDAIKEYAKELITSHQEADKKLTLYAQIHGLSLPGASAVDNPTGSPSANSESAVPSTARDLPGATGSPAPAGAATGMVNRHGDVASAGNSGGAAAGNPRVTSPQNPGAVTTVPSGSVSPGTISDARPAPELDAEGKKLVARLEKLEGEAFDKQFLTTMVRTHGKTLAKVKSLQSRKLEAELAGLLSDARSMVENHLQRAKELQRPAAARLPGSGNELGALR